MLRQRVNYMFNPWLLSLSILIITVLFFWPGIMSPDATSQYSMAKSNIYTDHHPPMMSLLWYYLDKIYPGPALIFLLHITLLYSSTAIFIYLFKNSNWKWWYAMYPALPNILAYTSLIVKDASFTFAYLLSASLLTLLITKNIHKHKYKILSLILLLLIYGTAVKFQAKFILLVFTFGIGYCVNNYKFNFKAIILSVTFFALILGSVTQINNKLVPNRQKSHSWQFVKIYDLTSISIKLDQPLYPDFILAQKSFDFARIKQEFLAQEVDPLVFTSSPHILPGHNETQRQALKEYWYSTVKTHPFIYLQCRWQLFKYNLFTAPSNRNDLTSFFINTPMAHIITHPVIEPIINNSYHILKVTLYSIWLIPIIFFYLYIGTKYFAKTKFAPPLLMFSVASILFMLIIFFFSMAATVRYLFLCTCLTHLAHGLCANIIYKQKAKIKEEITRLSQQTIAL